MCIRDSSHSAARNPQAIALTYGKQSMTYGELHNSIEAFVSGMRALDLLRGERIAIYLEKRLETVVASFGAAAAGCVFVPLNPLLKPDQVGYIMRGCNVRALITSNERLPLLTPVLDACHDLRHIVLVNAETLPPDSGPVAHLHWNDLLNAPQRAGHRVIDRCV